jgi:hypothetical protein
VCFGARSKREAMMLDFPRYAEPPLVDAQKVFSERSEKRTIALLLDLSEFILRKSIPRTGITTFLGCHAT